jgi:hypothetical protein
MPKNLKRYYGRGDFPLCYGQLYPRSQPRENSKRESTRLNHLCLARTEPPSTDERVDQLATGTAKLTYSFA